MRQVLYLSLFLIACAVPALAQDPVKVDPKHYKVEFENANVRVLRVRLARERSRSCINIRMRSPSSNPAAKANSHFRMERPRKEILSLVKLCGHQPPYICLRTLAPRR